MDAVQEKYMDFFVALAAFLAVFSGTIVFTSKDAFLTRLSAVVTLFVLNWTLYTSAMTIVPTVPMAGALATCLWCGCLSAAESVLISRATAKDLTKGNEKAGKITLLYRATCLLFNLRRAGTKWEIKGLTYDCPKSRLGFVAYKSFCMVIAFLFLDVTGHGPPAEPHMITKDKETLWNFGALSSEDVIFRLVTITMVWCCAYCYKYMINTSGAIISVGLGLSKPEAWPRLFNAPFSSLTSVRGFWR